MNEPETIRRMLEARTIAVVGLSDNVEKPSHQVAAYMQAQGYRIFPVNPLLTFDGIDVLGEKSYLSLAELPVKPDVVNVFRLPKAIPAIVEEMLLLGLKNLWVQVGIVNHEAAMLAERAGIRVVMDRCMKVEHRRLAEKTTAA